MFRAVFVAAVLLMVSCGAFAQGANALHTDPLNLDPILQPEL
jgi:hypothetical protein